MEPLPLYDQEQVPQNPFDALLTRIAVPLSSPNHDARVILDSFIESQKAPVYDGPEEVEPPKPIDHYPLSSLDDGLDLTLIKRQIVTELFAAIVREDIEAISMLIQQNLITPDATDEMGLTPLLAAISSKNVPVVKQLLALGGDCNRFGDMDGMTRTPLMLAASLGSLPLVRLLFEEPYSANDALVAPDGQIALRLAASAGHRAIVNYLPSRRSGAYLRIKTRNSKRIERMKEALHQMWTTGKIFIWHIPKFFVWTIPKNIVRSCKWCWRNRELIGRWIKNQVTEMPKRVARFGRACWKAAKKVPKAIWKIVKKIPNAIKEIAKSSWNLIKKIPDAIREITLALWRLVTVHIPKAARITFNWIWDGIKSIGRAIWDIIRNILSFLHTIFEAIISFLRNATLMDIWYAFCDILRAVFITLPKALWSWIENFGEISYRILRALFGSFGEVLWWIAHDLQFVVTYVPRKVWIILQNLAGSISYVLYELGVWINPKL